MSDRDHQSQNMEIMSNKPLWAKARHSVARSENNDFYSMRGYSRYSSYNYGSIANDNKLENDGLSYKTSFTFFEGKGESVFSQLSSSTNIGTSRSIHAFLNLFKIFVGIGILTGPASMSKCGVILGMLSVISAGLLSLYSINIQAQTRLKLQTEQEELNHQNNQSEHRADTFTFDYQSQDPTNQNNQDKVETCISNYSQLGKAAFGNSGYVFVSMCLFIQQMGSSTAYF